MIHKFQLNSINCAAMPRETIPATWFWVPFSILRIPCTEKIFFSIGVGGWGFQLSASEGKGQQALVQKTESGNSPT
ncbi:hypothetical protein H6F92_13340 [Microcystis wesenbergii FACHB-1317]|nr:hypothetical protein [Microcystis wesenbergii]MBD2289714.1 hypothetical protein [Microcystis wesenbergii FACHB-1317]REJ49885.1 MAG: hypothetical protein DWQ58_16025 [Microcystis aeruginosa TA09]